MRKWLLGTAAASVVLIIAIVLLYRLVQAEEWTAEKRAVETVTSSTYMKEALKTSFFNSDKPYAVVYGLDPSGQPMIAWVDENNSTHVEYASDGVSEQEIRNKVISNAPDNEVIRILPAKLEGVYAWEVYYRKTTEQGERYYYDYYRFRDGVHLETYKMALMP